MTETTTFDRDDPPILGANPFVGLTREQAPAALGADRATRRGGAGRAAATAVDALGEFVRIGIGRSDVAPARGDHRFTDATWQHNLLLHRLMQSTWSRTRPHTASSTRSSSTPRAAPEPVSRCR